MSLLRSRFALPAVLAVTLAAVTVGATPANAAYQRAQCNAGDGYAGTGWTYYNYTGGYDVISFYEYLLTKGGNQSNIAIVQVGEGYQWSSDSVGSNIRYTHVPRRTVRIPGSTNTRTYFNFVFDKSGFDPGCYAYTPTW